ncbi:hypothetical protein DFJ58DRAFT_419139 [Suillus subalutaceus]|uniref:uncharacterized protein n=1 Tax=Suillus subalutaceus TaxID=48586 RepID=UPI001B860A7F|nr:uncharacterized protein DFJ58DRAFT_419139 [Suillus subalutaceus]KAG1851857.1 hypothetical protein DFJ58DRAFT_419139 [Suillus subalutaceus]
MNATQHPTSSTLPPPAVQNQFLQYSITKKKRDDEDDTSAMVTLKNYLFEEVDGQQSTAPLNAYCFMTGFTDSITYSATFIWCAFQTGNSLRLALAFARLFDGQHDPSFDVPDGLALCSLLMFIFGAFIGRLGDKLGCKTRLWLTLGTFVQTLLTMVATIAIWKSHQGSIADGPAHPAWTNVLSFMCIGSMSASMGLQAIMGRRINTQFGTTVVFTSVWCELMADPKLFNIRRIVVSRDHKIMAIIFMFLGGVVGPCIDRQSWFSYYVGHWHRYPYDYHRMVAFHPRGAG